MDASFSTPTKPKRKSKRKNTKLDRAFTNARSRESKHKAACENEIIAEQKLREEMKKMARLSAKKKRVIRKCDSTKEEADAQLKREIKSAKRKHAKAHKKADQDCDVEVRYIDGLILTKDRDVNKAGNDLVNCRDEVEYTLQRKNEAYNDLIVANGGTLEGVSIMLSRPTFSSPPARNQNNSNMIDQIEPTTIASPIVTTPKEAKKRRSRRIQAQQRDNDPPASEIIEIASDDSSVDSSIALSSDASSVDFS